MSNNFNGSNNVAIGPYAMFDNYEGGNNVGLGDHALYQNETGDQNTVVGAYAGYGQNGSNYSGNVFIGYSAGYHETSSNRLYIENSSDTLPLIYGEFDNKFVRINGDTEVAVCLILIN